MKPGTVFFVFLLATSSSSLLAQKRVELGLFVDSLSISQTSTNNFGLGGRFGYGVRHDMMLEDELAYDCGIKSNIL